MQKKMNKKTHFGFKEVDEKDKNTHVGGVFSSVAENYDIMNDAMSLGMHRIWKKILVELAAISEKDVILDIASGTGDIAKLISKEYPHTEIYMTDINIDMLAEGRDRSINESFYKNCHFCQLSGETMPFDDEAFDVITIGFGLRNFTNKEAGLKEMRRCLKKDGRLLILEFSKPTNPIFSKIYDWYSFNILPKLGSVLANDSESYQYLAESIRMHPDQELLKTMVLESGFKKCKFYNLLNGVVSIHVAYEK
jgi:demethylmenaquinone methyltransferase/2-methoxy-6-polyprenyl-1,4-benzoquinol methylase